MRRPRAARSQRHVRPQLLLADRRRPAAEPAEDGHDPPRRQVREVQEGHGRAGPRRPALRAAREDLRRRHRQGRGEAADGALPARDRARQPGDPPPRGHGELPRAALQPRRDRRGHRHGHPLLRDLRGPSGPACGSARRTPRAAAARRRTPRTRPRTPTRTERRTRGSAPASRRRTPGTTRAAPPRAPRSSAARARRRGRTRPSRRASCAAPPGASRRPCPRFQTTGNGYSSTAAWRSPGKQSQSAL